MKDKELEVFLEEYKLMKHILFIIGETLVDQSKCHITSDEAITKIRKTIQQMNRGYVVNTDRDKPR